MSSEVSFELSLFVEHGREQEAADFYARAFGAEQVDTYSLHGALIAVELRFGSMPVTITGSNPKREQEPSRGGPFFPKNPGAVSAILRLNVGSLDQVVQKAVSVGATIRSPVQTDQTGRRAATVFDPFGHIWALVERPVEDARQAA